MSLYIEIQKDGETEVFKLYSDIKRQMNLKTELLSKFSKYQKITITGKGVEPETLLLEDLFCEPIERVRNAGLILPGK
jgi:hypothetical protein